MNLRETIQELIIETTKHWANVAGVVKSVNKDTGVCDVWVDGKQELATDALVKPVKSNGTGSIIIWPKVDTWVLLTCRDHQPMNAFIIMVEEAESITLNGDQFGGLVKADELKTQIDKNTQAISDLITVLKTWVIPGAPDGGLALKNAIIAQFPIVSLANLSNIENEIIKHG